MEIRPVRDELFRAYRQTDIYYDANTVTRRIRTFRSTTDRKYDDGGAIIL